MARFQHKPVTSRMRCGPIRSASNELFEMDDFVIGRMVHEPGWRWSNNVRPIAGTERCMYHHLGYCVSGRLHVTLRDGSEAEIGAAEVVRDARPAMTRG